MSKQGYKMTGAELASQLKGSLGSNMLFNGISGVDDESLHLAEESMRWWRDAKLGLFIHWGVYSAIGKGEWAYFNEGYTEEQYRQTAEHKLRPDRSAAEIVDEWLGCAQSAGMRYAVMTARHHDGFALWDSAASYHGFTAPALGLEDHVRAFTDGCRRRGLRTGIYYSPMDWRFEGYFDPHGKTESALEMKAQAYAQVRELCSGYGKLDILWYDGGWLAHSGSDADAAWLWEPLKLNRMVRELQPDILLSPRSGYRGDFECDEGDRTPVGRIVPIPWEKELSVSQTWGYMPDDRFKSAEEIISVFVNTLCRDGNMLLNIAPDANGRVPKEVKETLRGLGSFVEQNAEAVYGTRAGLFEPTDGVFGSVYKGDNVYLYVLDCRRFSQLDLPDIGRRILSARILGGEELGFTQGNGIRLSLPEKYIEKSPAVTVIKLVTG